MGKNAIVSSILINFRTLSGHGRRMVKLGVSCGNSGPCSRHDLTVVKIIEQKVKWCLLESGGAEGNDELSLNAY